MLPYALPYGNYEIIEQNTCFGYVLDSTPVAFKVDGSTELVTVVKSNYAQKGTITISKFGEVFSSVVEKDGIYQPVYEIKGLEGAVYEVIAVEDVITLDGTTRYTKGQVVATITTGKDGKATTEPLYLGKYEIREVKAPYGMVLNTEPVNVELVYAGEHVEITETSASFTNERQKIVIDLKKSMENDELFGIGMNGEIICKEHRPEHRQHRSGRQGRLPGHRRLRRCSRHWRIRQQAGGLRQCQRLCGRKRYA